jgi:hypothetical protein
MELTEGKQTGQNKRGRRSIKNNERAHTICKKMKSEPGHKMMPAQCLQATLHSEKLNDLLKVTPGT